jgi:hypothetical protein
MEDAGNAQHSSDSYGGEKFVAFAKDALYEEDSRSERPLEFA